MHLFQLEYLSYLALDGLSLFFLFASIMAIPGNAEPTNKREQIIFDLWGKILVVAFKGIPMLSVAAVAAFLFHFDQTGKIISCLNFLVGLILIVLVVTYWRMKS